MKVFEENRGITLISLVVTIVVLLILAGISISALFGDNGILNNSKEAKSKYNSAAIKEKLELAISEAQIDQYTNTEKPVNYENLIGYNGILQEKVPEIANWVSDDILLCNDYYFQITKELKVKKVNFKATYKSIQEMQNDGNNLKEDDIVSTLSYYKNGNRSGGATYKITANIGDLKEDEGRVIRIFDTNLYAVLQMYNNGLNVMQYGAYGDGNTDDTKTLQKIFDMIYKNGGGTIYFPEGTYISKIQENTGYSSSRSCLTLLGGNVNLIGNGKSEIKEVGINGGDLSEDYLYDENVGKYYRGHLLMLGSNDEPVNENITIKGLILNGGASTMPTYEESASWDGTTANQWDITHKGIYLYNGKNSNSNNIIIENCNFKNFRGEAYYGGTYLSDNSKVINTAFENCVTGISTEGITLIENCNFNSITFNPFEAYVVKNMTINSCKFKDCNRGLEILNNDNWGTGVICEIKNCEFVNLNVSIRSYGGGIRNINNNLFKDCSNSVIISDGNENAEYIISDNNFIIDNRASNNGNSINMYLKWRTKVTNNKFTRTNLAKENNYKGGQAFNLLYYSSVINLENINLCYLDNNYVEPGYCVYGQSDVDKEISWNVSQNCNFARSSGGIYIGYGNQYDTSSQYGNGVYRPCKIDINGIVNEDCIITIKVEYYAFGGEKDETIEETIFEGAKSTGEEFFVTFNKTIITDARRIYPVVKIYNSKNSSTAVNAKFTLTQN